MGNTAVWWIRRDLRLADNEALHAALAVADRVIPLFIADPFFKQSRNVGSKRRNFLSNALYQLDKALRDKESRLILRHGDPTEVLPAFLAETGATAFYAAEDYGPYGRRRDTAVAETIPLHLTAGLTLHHPQNVLKKNGTPYTVFTPFKKNAWLAQPLPRREMLLPAPEAFSTPPDIPTNTLPERDCGTAAVYFPACEVEARHRLEKFLQNDIYRYNERRDLPAKPGTGLLSPYFRFGLLSPREAVVGVVEMISKAPDNAARESAQTWLSELIWREFYQAILYQFPHVARRSFRPEYDRIRWRNDEAEFAAWCAGETGYPLVDAAMRQLNQTGWMHNRSRMVVASFLVKDLLIDWRWGERYFMQQLVDGDLAANNGGWQWAAGTGTDAAPYFRIFNPITQSKKFDPRGEYLRRWLPELANVPDKFIHAPWEMAPARQKAAGCLIGVDYPAPVVDHKMARERTLAAYKAAREG